MRKKLLLILAVVLTSSASFAAQNPKRFFKPVALKNVQSSSKMANENAERGVNNTITTVNEKLDLSSQKATSIRKTITSGNVLVAWDFDNDPYGTVEDPTDWSAFDIDEQPNYGTNEANAWYLTYEGNLYGTAPENIVIASKSWFAASADYVENDDWLTTPDVPIPTTSTYEVVWDARALQKDPYNDGYEVRIAIADDLWNALAALPETATTAEVGDALVENSTVKFSIDAEEATLWMSRKIDLTEYAGKTIVVLFRSHNLDKNVLYLDNIAIQETEAYVTDVVVSGLPTIIYYQEPSFLATPSVYSSTPEITVKSKGANPVTNVKATLAQFANYNLLASEEISFGTIAAGEAKTLATSAPFSITAGTGSHYFAVEAIPEEAGAESAFESDEQEVVLSESTFAVDNNVPSGSLYISDTGTTNKYTGAIYNFPQDLNIKSVDFMLGETTQTSTLVKIYDLTAGAFVATSPSVTVAPSSDGIWYNATFATPFEAKAGVNYIIALEEQPLKKILVMRSGNGGPGAYTLSAAPTNSDWNSYTAAALMIRPNVALSTGFGNVQLDNTIAYAVKNGISVVGMNKLTSIAIYNVQGKLMYSDNISNEKTYSVASGLYFVKAGNKVAKVFVK